MSQNKNQERTETLKDYAKTGPKSCMLLLLFIIMTQKLNIC